jgi:hypothetical protein
MNSTIYCDVSTTGLFDRFSGFDCSNKQDRVYVIMCFPSLIKIYPPVLPNDNKTLAEVFKEAIEDVVQPTRGLACFLTLIIVFLLKKAGYYRFQDRFS